MKILKRGELTYYIKEESVIIGIRDSQFIAYTVYTLQNRSPFYQFKETIKNSRDDEYSSIIDLLALARKHKLIGVSSSRPKNI